MQHLSLTDGVNTPIATAEVLEGTSATKHSPDQGSHRVHGLLITHTLYSLMICLIHLELGLRS